MYVKLYFANVSCLKNAELYGKFYRELPPERQAAADRLRFDKDRRLSVGAFALLKYAVKNEGGVPKISFGDHGKTYFEGRDDLFFNLSHSGDIALCSLSDSRIGCDVEKIRKPPLSVAKRFFSPAERDYVMSAKREEERAERFFCVWTLKESFLKATGSGFSVPSSSFSVVGGKVLGAGDDAWSAEPVQLVEGYASAYCVKGSAHAVPLIEEADLEELDF